MASTGKFDRCQLGHWEQLERIEKLHQQIQVAVRERLGQHASAKDVESENHDRKVKDELLVSCLHHLQDPNNEDTIKETHSHLLFAAQRDPVVAAVIRDCGFRAVTKFNRGFKTADACELTLLYASPFQSLANDCLRTGPFFRVDGATPMLW